MDEITFIKMEITGSRTFVEMIDKWGEISKVINNPCELLLVADKMQGKLTTDEVSKLITLIEIKNFYYKGKIAVVLEEKDSYDTRFFDSITKTMKLNVKHFTDEEEAKVWLTRK